ncbi:carbon-nitrogen hydrolase family protein [Cochlodiniinecator piscidefendens]|uniref:carbon-nitrogen hydrolase family protein n=1 Tax=Cochlodiniinecator piscidefendens TaxID=2715756 RepID=UPI00140A13EB|nr:carbon-nitrogen hydrolase family protein [Cochlodiniinecator piscidefendens]
MKIATAAYPIDWHETWASYVEKTTKWVAEAANNGAVLLVFPEYGAMELASLAGANAAGDIEASMQAVSDSLEQANALYAELAASFGIYILGASAPCYVGKRPVNRAMFFTPDGQLAQQDKQIMTRFERDTMDVIPGGPLTVFDTKIGRIGVIICYDSEFPDLSRALIEQDVEILLAPSCTEGLSGYWRVRIGAMARALESQCVVVHSPTVGAAEWNPIVDMNTGAAAIYGPPDNGFPDTGVIAEGKLNEPGWVYGEISLDAIREVRRDGRVLNKTHWSEQESRVQTVTIADLLPKNA